MNDDEGSSEAAEDVTLRTRLAELKIEHKDLDASVEAHPAERERARALLARRF